MKKYKETLTRILILMLGLTIAHLGVSLFLIVNLGTDPFNVFVQGLFRMIDSTFGLSFLTHGRVHICISFIIIIALLFVDKSYVKIGTLLCMFCGGPIIDFFDWLIGPLFAGDVHMAVKVITNIVGCAILAFGMTIVIKSEAGTGPNDLVAVVISDKSKKKFSIIRIVVDICFAGIGFALGGTLGLGTIICAFVVGPVAQIFMPINEKAINAVLKKVC